MHKARVLPRKVKWYSPKQKPNGRRRASPRQLVTLRLHDFARIFRSRYGTTLPDDDAGRDVLIPVLHHIAAKPRAAELCSKWLELWAPWMTIAESREAIAAAIIHPRAWSADQLAWRYRITMEQRTMLGLTTIGAIDCNKAARTKRRKEQARKRKAVSRRAAGIKPRQQALERLKPWRQQGISRRTWYRHKRALAQRGTDTATP